MQASLGRLAGVSPVAAPPRAAAATAGPSRVPFPLPHRHALASSPASSKKSGNGAGKTAHPHTPAPAPAELEDLIRHKYFSELFTGGDYTLAPTILAPDVVHKDMVRDEAYCGVGEIVDYMRDVKKSYPGFMVRATSVAPAPDGRALFVAFEGHAAEGLPTFRGVDVFWFNERGQVAEVNVYRSNWAGAKGHAARKAEMEARLRWEAEERQRR